MGALVVAVNAAAPGRSTPIFAGRALLADCGAALDRVRNLSGSSPVQFAAAYAPLAENVAEYVQRLPAVGDPEPTILAARLRRAEGALARRRARLLPPDADPERIAREADLWTYVAFGLALLRGLARDLDAWTVALWTADRRPLGLWRPWEAPWGLARVAGAAAYTVDRHRDPPSADWTPLAAGALMPADGLHWVWREPAVLAVWTRALTAELPAELASWFDASPRSPRRAPPCP